MIGWKIQGFTLNLEQPNNQISVSSSEIEGHALQRLNFVREHSVIKKH